MATLQQQQQHNHSNKHNRWDLLALPTSRRSLAVGSWGLASSSPPWLVRPAHAADAATKTSGDFPAVDDPEASYAQLGPIGKVIAGTLEIVVSTALEYLSGYVGGYALGTVTGLPAFFLKKSDSTAAAAAGVWNQLGARATRMHGKSARWAGSWAGISAAFGGFRVTTKVLRGGKEDEWSTVFSSMAAGAWFARNGACNVAPDCLVLFSVSREIIVLWC